MKLTIGILLSILAISLAIAMPTIDLETSNRTSSLIRFTGAEEVVAFSSQLQHTPDENISFIKSGGQIHLWTQGSTATGGGTYYFVGSDFDDLAAHETANGLPVPVLMPSGSGFDRTYAGSGSVLRAANGSDLLMFYHGEDQSCGVEKPPIVGIGLARSQDGGANWTRLGQVISSAEIPTDCNYSGFKGAGNPTVVVSPDGQFLYMYYMEWLSTRPDEISLARAPITSDGVPGSWVKYKDGSFSTPGLGGESDVVIQRANEIAGYAGVPHVSFNENLNLYLAIVMGHNGFYETRSPDGINWKTPQLFWEVPALTVVNDIKDGDSWYYYPTLMSLEQETSQSSTQVAYLYYAHGTKNGPPHYMVRRPVTINFSLYLPIIIAGGTSPIPTATPTQLPPATATPTPTALPTVATPAPTATLARPSPVSIEAGGVFEPLAGWTWICRGDFLLTQANGTSITLHDSIAETGLIAHLQPDSQVTLTAPWGGYCAAFDEGSYSQALEQAIGDMFANGCTASGCSSINVKEVAPLGDIVADYWVLGGCPAFTPGMSRQVSAGEFVVGDIVIDKVIQYDYREGEGTVAYFEAEALVYAQWGATCYHADSPEPLIQVIESEFEVGCDGGCDKVRAVLLSPSGEQNALCYYPDGSTQPLQMNADETWCP